MAKHFKNALSLVLILSVLMGFAGCAFFDRIHVTIDPKADNVSGAEIIRLLVSAIDDDAHLSDSYAAIPENQRKGISYPDYYQYVSILRAYSNANGKIKSFRYLNEEENSKHLDSIYTKLSQNCLVDDYYTVFSNYGEVRTVVFEYEKEPEYPVYTYITLDEDGDPYLSFDLISHIISSYNYMKQYLKLITSEKVDGISALLVPEANIPDKYVDRVLSSKAKFIIDYYKYRVKQDPEQFVLISANPFYVEYNIPDVLSADVPKLYERKIFAFRTPDGALSIADKIEQDVNSDVLLISISANQSIRCGQEYDSSVITKICGKPVSSFVTDLEEENQGEEGENSKKKILLSYNGMNLTFIANISDEDEGEWIGELVSVRIYNNTNYSVCGIHVDDEEIDIVERFPMIKYGDYKLSYTSKNTAYNLEYEIKDGKVDDIVIKQES